MIVNKLDACHCEDTPEEKEIMRNQAKEKEHSELQQQIIRYERQLSLVSIMG